MQNGHKAGRDFGRDQLDERVILDGVLARTDSIIRAFNKNGEKYLHITLAFREDFLDVATLKAIVEEFKKYCFSAYKSDEYDFYAEAHLPRIKSYINNKTGEEIERKPHIHIVIPTTNLVSHQDLHPFGFDQQNIVYLDAIQEHINNKFGLASPKDHARLRFTDASEMISRYKGDVFKGANSDLRGAILSQILEREIQTPEDFASMLESFGAVSTGRGGDYFKVTLEGSAKAVRLTNSVFTPDFIRLSTADKLAFLNATQQREYSSAARAKRDPTRITETLEKWEQLRARELRYVNSGNRKFYKKYQNASLSEKMAILDDQEAAFHKEHRKELSNERQNQQHHAQSLGKEPPPAARGRLRSVSELGMVRFGERSEVLLQSDVRHQLDHERTKSDSALRRGGDWAGERISDDFVSQLHHDHKEAEQIERAGRDADISEIRRKIDASQLLAYLSHSHGVLPEKYEVTKATDGTDRIKCGNRHLSVSDFLTKEMHLSWRDHAEPILREVYRRQVQEPRQEARQAIKNSLWRDFQAWKATSWDDEKKNAWAAQVAAEKQLFAKIRSKFQKEKADVNKQSDLTYSQRRAQRSILQMQKVELDQKARAARDTDRAALKSKFNLRSSTLYRNWLRQEAERGRREALEELRRQETKAVREKALGKDALLPVAKAKISHDMLDLARITYTVDRYGDVTYKSDGAEFLRDESTRLIMLRKEDADIETALRLGIQKFGPTLTLTGTDEFKRRVVDIAQQHRIQVGFADEFSSTYQAQQLVKIADPAGGQFRPGEAHTSKGVVDKLRKFAEENKAKAEQRRLQEEERMRIEQQRPQKPGTDYTPE
ncbi:LPD7 domain-containing protein [Herbaspirillum huttiense]|uniref:LPD7 domain-containing protein n=1 Tax=Herbaspirillum huttiense TaxID=863372 RepID=UPI003821CA10